MNHDGKPTLMWHLLRWLFIVLSIPGASRDALADAPRLGPFDKPQPRELTIPHGDEPFDASEALNGSHSSARQCADVPNGLWVEVDGKGDCIRYYAHGLAEGGNPAVLVYFGGDVMLRTSRGVRFISQSYRTQSPNGLQSDMEQWSAEAGTPAIYIARPGIYGSSGDHNMRRHRREIALMNGALDQIKARYGIANFILAGQSAGGQIVAGLLNWRDDILAVAISSGLVSTQQVARFWEKRRKIPGWLLYDAKQFYDPVSEVERIRKDPPPQIYVISDPEDRVVPFFSQLYYVRRLKTAGLKPQHIYAHAADQQRHVLYRSARLAAALIARGEDPKDIRRALQELEFEQAE